MITIEEARDKENAYVPNTSTQQLMKRVVLVPFVGATAVGKNYLMKACGYHVVGTTLTRGPRPDDDPTKNNYVSNEFTLASIEASEVVQYAVSPTSDTIYCSMISDYMLDVPNVMDCFFDAIEGLSSKGYADIKTVSVFTPIEQWRVQLQERYANDAPAYIRGRLEEAARSIAWSLDQHTQNKPNHLLVINDASRLDANVATIHAFVDGRSYKTVSSDEACQVAADMQNLINEYKRGVPLVSDRDET